MKSITTTALAVLLACPAFAAPNCASHADVEAIITQGYGEVPIATGLDERGNFVIWWGNPETGTWTATVSRGDQTCIVSQGDSFKREALAPNV